MELHIRLKKGSRSWPVDPYRHIERGSPRLVLQRVVRRVPLATLPLSEAGREISGRPALRHPLLHEVSPPSRRPTVCDLSRPLPCSASRPTSTAVVVPL